MTDKVIPFRRKELEHTEFGRRRLTPEQRAWRSKMSKCPRRSKNGTPEERAAKVSEPKAIIAKGYRRNRLAHEAITRAAQITRILGIEEERAEEFLGHMCELDPKDDNCEHMTAVVKWIFDTASPWIGYLTVIRAAWFASLQRKRKLGQQIPASS